MLNKLFVKIILRLLKSKKITGENKSLVLNALLENIGTLPISRAIGYDNLGGLLIQGKKIDLEKLGYIRESLMAYRDNQARKLIREQLKMLAIEYGVHNGLNVETILFSKAMLYNIQEEEKLLQELLAE